MCSTRPLLGAYFHNMRSVPDDTPVWRPKERWNGPGTKFREVIEVSVVRDRISRSVS